MTQYLVQSIVIVSTVSKEFATITKILKRMPSYFKIRTTPYQRSKLCYQSLVPIVEVKVGKIAMVCTDCHTK